jgi:hypothetical protein
MLGRKRIEGMDKAGCGAKDVVCGNGMRARPSTTGLDYIYQQQRSKPLRIDIGEPDQSEKWALGVDAVPEQRDEGHIKDEQAPFGIQYENRTQRDEHAARVELLKQCGIEMHLPCHPCAKPKQDGSAQGDAHPCGSFCGIQYQHGCLSRCVAFASQHPERKYSSHLT